MGIRCLVAVLDGIKLRRQTNRRANVDNFRRVQPRLCKPFLERRSPPSTPLVRLIPVMALRPLLLLLAALQLPLSLAAFIAIDYGSDWTKVSLMGSGRKMEILLNTDSKRKFQSAVGWKKDDRSFSTDAVNLVSPTTVSHLNTFLIRPLFLNARRQDSLQIPSRLSSI